MVLIYLVEFFNLDDCYGYIVEGYCVDLVLLDDVL